VGGFDAATATVKGDAPPSRRVTYTVTLPSEMMERLREIHKMYEFTGGCTFIVPSEPHVAYRAALEFALNAFNVSFTATEWRPKDTPMLKPLAHKLSAGDESNRRAEALLQKAKVEPAGRTEFTVLPGLPWPTHRIVVNSHFELANVLRVEPGDLSFFCVGDGQMIVYAPVDHEDTAVFFTTCLNFAIEPGKDTKTEAGTLSAKFETTASKMEREEEALRERLAAETKHMRVNPLEIVPTPPVFTKCEQLIYDAARQALAEPHMRTRLMLTQQIDYWLYQLQTANLARPKPGLPPAPTGVAG
jgi:hypothetical protein